MPSRSGAGLHLCLRENGVRRDQREREGVAQRLMRSLSSSSLNAFTRR